jgi:anthranilate phosphoribosyltransferase
MDTNQLITSVIGRIATGPELSKNISFDEAREAMNVVLRGETSAVRQAIFLIALRMKRETMEENQGILQAIIDQTRRVNVNVPTLIDLGDPYSGYDRSVPISAFLPPLLAELGLPSVIHSLRAVSPKYGLTHHHIAQAMGLDPLLSMTNAQAKIEDKSVAWSYIDQATYCPSLHNLVPLRNDIIKRSVLNTVETLVKPFVAEQTHSVLGFVHKPYPPIYASLANFSSFDSSLLIRGVEGGVVPSLRQQGLAISYQGEEEIKRLELHPEDIGINSENRSIAMPDGDINEQAKRVVELGIEALSGKKGDFYNGLLLSGVLILLHLNKAQTTDEAVDLVKAALDSGKALTRIK